MMHAQSFKRFFSQHACPNLLRNPPFHIHGVHIITFVYIFKIIRLAPPCESLECRIRRNTQMRPLIRRPLPKTLPSRASVNSPALFRARARTSGAWHLSLPFPPAPASPTDLQVRHNACVQVHSSLYRCRVEPDI